MYVSIYCLSQTWVLYIVNFTYGINILYDLERVELFILCISISLIGYFYKYTLVGL